MSVELRPPSEGDAPAITAFLAEHGRSAIDESEVGEAEVRHWLTIPTLWLQLVERDGRLAGYLDLVTEDDEHYVADIRALDRETADALLAAAEARIGHGRVHGVAQGTDDLAREVYEAAGYALIRHSFQMRIELDGDPPEPEWADGFSVRNFRSGDEERVYAAHQDAFADHWDFHPQTFEHWRAYTLDRHDFDPALWWLVENGDELAGLSLNCWHMSEDPQFGWVQILGVRPPWRRRGLGASLLRQSFRDFAARGATRVGLGVDAENTTGAVRLYERAGMHVHRRNDIYEKTL
ncbi:MAG: GNAT family N-acetyltransferase [Gaiellaceae bacterium]